MPLPALPVNERRVGDSERTVSAGVMTRGSQEGPAIRRRKRVEACVLPSAYSTPTRPTSSAAPQGKPTCRKSRRDCAPSRRRLARSRSFSRPPASAAAACAAPAAKLSAEPTVPSPDPSGWLSGGPFPGASASAESARSFERCHQLIDIRERDLAVGGADPHHFPPFQFCHRDPCTAGC